MKSLKLFHGSDHIIEAPVYLGGKDDNDYGNGFYTTEFIDRAKSWAALNGSEETAIVNQYNLCMDGLSILNLDDCGVLSWIAEILNYRGFRDDSSTFLGKKIIELYKIDTAPYDIIIGYRADDSYIQVIDDFLLNYVNLHEVKELFYKGSLGTQVFLKSKRAFENTSFETFFYVEISNEYLMEDMKIRRDVLNKMRKRRNQVLVEDYKVTGITAREAVKNRLTYHKEADCYE